MQSPTPEDLKRQSAFSRAMHSIRTRYSLATAAFLLTILGMFYIGGRIVLVHFVRDAENQVQGIGLNIGRIVNRDADRVCRIAEYAAQTSDSWTTAESAEALWGKLGPEVSLIAFLDEKGRFERAYKSGVAASQAGDRPQTLSDRDLEPYAKNFAAWAETDGKTNVVHSVGLMDVCGTTHYAALARRTSRPGFVMVGVRFDMQALTARMNESLSGMEVRVKRRSPQDGVPVAISRRNGAAPAPRKPSFGLVPMVSEAINFYSGGFWEFGTNPLEAAFTIRDIAGNPLSVIAVSLPRTFSSATSVALGRLTFFITTVGMILILPIFWFQSQLLLNPLSTMIERIRKVGERHNDMDCPRLEWTGKDEFAQLAVSVNQMLETISRRSLAIAQSEARQKAMLANLPDGLVIFDRQRRVVTIIKQPDDGRAVPGFKEGEPPDEGIFGADALKDLGKAVDAAFAEGTPQRLQLTTAGGEGGRRIFALRMARMDDFFTIGSMRDITAEVAEHDRLHVAERQLARMQRQESMAQLANGIAHDVNNVLSVVLSTPEITWMDGSIEDPIIASAVATIRDAVRRGTGMMRELMTFAGETKMELRRCDPAELVRSTSRLAAGATGPNVVLNYDLPEGLPAIDADPDQLWKVFFNLVKNAAEALGGRPGEITVSAKAFDLTAAGVLGFTTSRTLKPGPGVLFQVADNGPGIPPDMARRIFDPYVSTKAAGRGLGLAIVASIVSSHGGGISVRSGAAGGTTFSIFLPVSKLPADAAPKETTSASTASASDLTPGDVLLVDDDDGILKTTSILLRALKYVPHAAGEPATALTEFRRSSARLKCVLLDANLGQYDSIRLLRAFRLANPNVPVIVTSGETQEEVTKEFSSQPFNGFLAKPYTLDELRTALARCQAR